ncbi:MAG: peptidylprolyl isomerase [Eubacterium sp.]|nr:peptidylprolyl isomerase [Eubacterium sp.]
MAKKEKELNDDLFAGGSIADGEKKSKKEKKSKQGKKAKKGISAHTAKIIKFAVAVVIVVALLATYVATGLVRKGFVHSTLQWTTYLTAVTIKNDDGDKINVPVSTYNYYYALTYNNLKQRQAAANDSDDENSALMELLGMLQEPIDADFTKPLASQTTTDDDGETITWQDYVYNEVMDSIEETYTYYLAAIRDNDGAEPEITTTQKSELESTLSEYREAAEKYGYTLSAYLVAVMGKGVTEQVFRREAVRSYIADNYKSSISSEKVTVEHTDADYDKYRTENADKLKAVNVRIYEAKNEKDAKAFKDALKADASNFAELAVKYAEGDFYKSYYADASATTLTDVTRDFLSKSAYTIASPDDASKDDEDKTYPGLDWLFNADRKAGDVNQFTNTVVYVVSPAAEPKGNTVNIRHILISPKDDPSKATEASAADWKAAKEKADKILDQFNSGKKTADNFAALAKENTADPGSKDNGGLYSDVAPGQMVTTFNNWCFADGRKAGDVGMVQTESGYHIMYLDSITDTPIWKALTIAQLDESETVKKTDKIEEEFYAKVNWFGSRYFEIDTDIDR